MSAYPAWVRLLIAELMGDAETVTGLREERFRRGRTTGGPRVVVPGVGPGESVEAAGADIDVEGDVAGEVRGRTVHVEGDVRPGARIIVSGANASVYIEGDVAENTVIQAMGADSEVVVEGDVG